MPHASVFRRSPCRLCGRPIVWAVTEDGSKSLPLDPVAPVYVVTFDENDGRTIRCRRAEEKDGPPRAAMVSHFATCSKVSDIEKLRGSHGAGSGEERNPGG